MRKWSVKVFLLDQQGREHPANCFQKVVYTLHPSFVNAIQSKFDTMLDCGALRLLTLLQLSPRLPSPARMRDGVNLR